MIIKNLSIELKKREVKALEKLDNSTKIYLKNPDLDYCRMQSSSYNSFFTLFLHSYFDQNNILIAKNWIFHAALSNQIKSKCTKSGAGHLINSIGPAIAPLLSDNIDIINDISNWKSKLYHEDNIKRGTLFYIIKELIKGDKKNAEYLWENGKNHPDNTSLFYTLERMCLKYLILGDEERLRQEIIKMIAPDMHIKTLDHTFIGGYFFSAIALSYMKLAFHLGIQINIEHELLPKGLAEFSPLDNYHIKYEFMKRNMLKC